MSTTMAAERPRGRPASRRAPDARPTDPLAGSATTVRFLDVPERRCLMVDGHGAPEGNPEFQAAVGLLFSVAYALRWALKRERALVTRVGPLEGLWDIGLDWRWTLFIGIPEEASDDDVTAAIQTAAERRAQPGLPGLRVERWTEGRSAQILHVGPYAAEAPPVERLTAAIRAAGHEPVGRHHEIYLGDPRRAAPDRLRTLIRRPIA